MSKSSKIPVLALLLLFAIFVLAAVLIFPRASASSQGATAIPSENKAVQQKTEIETTQVSVETKKDSTVETPPVAEPKTEQNPEQKTDQQSAQTPQAQPTIQAKPAEQPTPVTPGPKSEADPAPTTQPQQPITPSPLSTVPVQPAPTQPVAVVVPSTEKQPEPANNLGSEYQSTFNNFCPEFKSAVTALGGAYVRLSADPEGISYYIGNKLAFTHDPGNFLIMNESQGFFMIIKSYRHPQTLSAVKEVLKVFYPSQYEEAFATLQESIEKKIDDGNPQYYDGRLFAADYKGNNVGVSIGHK